MQAGANVPGNLKNVEKLLDHPAFSITNPNACYSLFLSFVRSSVNFHAADGSGYKFIADSVLKVGFCGSRLVFSASFWLIYKIISTIPPLVLLNLILPFIASQGG